jgi:hypothetical protein
MAANLSPECLVEAAAGDFKGLKLERNGGFLYPFFQLFSILPYGSTCCHSLVWLKMAKTGCRRCPLVSPSLFESSVVFGVLLLKSVGYQAYLLLFDRFWGFHFIGCQAPQTWHTCRCVGRDL